MGRHAIGTGLAAALLLAPAAALAGGDAARGAHAVNACKACHFLDTMDGRIGPGLLGVVGRKAGSDANFDNYSDAMKAAGAAGLVWDEKNLAEFLRSPRGKVPGTNMTFAGVHDDRKIADIIAYLKADPKP